MNEGLITKLREAVNEACQSGTFIHKDWFYEYHLEILEKIALELCAVYPAANKNKVLHLTWLHDYEKIVEATNQYNSELLPTRKLMQKLGFELGYIEEICADINKFNEKQNIDKLSIEIQIVSSADAASHMVGPFFAIYWYENPNKPIKDLMAENLRKLEVDWNTKITLPEVKEKFRSRYELLREQFGKLPIKYI